MFKRVLAAVLALVAAGACAFGIMLHENGGSFSFSLPEKQEVFEVEFPTPANPDHQEFTGGRLNIGRIFIGDSRFVGMNDAVHLTDEPDQFLVAEVGKGCAWLNQEALPAVGEIRAAHADEYDAWQLVICLGINDLSNIDRYLETYYVVGSDSAVEVVLVSVAPVGPGSSISSDSVIAFNQRLADSGFYYIDTYSVVAASDFVTDSAGLHYTNPTYELIYDTILENL